jgi:hypothetical protein
LAAPQVARQYVPSAHIGAEQNNAPWRIPPGATKGTSGLLGSRSGKYGADTAISNQKHTSVAPRMATHDSRQLRTAAT